MHFLSQDGAVPHPNCRAEEAALLEGLEWDGSSKEESEVYCTLPVSVWDTDQPGGEWETIITDDDINMLRELPDFARTKDSELHPSHWFERFQDQRKTGYD